MSTRGFVGYRYQGQVRGWYNNSDSYPEELGRHVLTQTFTMTQEQLKTFFLKKVRLVSDYKAYRETLNLNWKRCRKITLEDAQDFYKDGIYCEYSYIFDLDVSEPTLLLFRGFGKGPSKGYENWFIRSNCRDKIYMIPCEPLVFSSYPDQDRAFLWMYIRLYEVRQNDKDILILKDILTAKSEDIPLFIDAPSKMVRHKDMATTLLETRLKETK